MPHLNLLSRFGRTVRRGGERRTLQARNPIQVRDGCLEGSIAWPHDPFFRPCVGLFVDHALRIVVPTVRRPITQSVSKGAWLCTFKAELEPLGIGTELERVEVVCLESGITLPVTHADRRDLAAPVGHLIRVDDLIAVAQARQQSWDCTGFVSFLNLSVYDQIDLLYRDILGRGVDGLGAESFYGNIISGKSTILDLRDLMVAGDEFTRTRRGHVAQHLGQWIVWGGLNDVVDSIVPNDLTLSDFDRSPTRTSADLARDFSSSLERICPISELGTYLGRIACGSNAPPPLIEQWQHDHSREIERRTRYIEQRRTGREARGSAPSHRMTYAGLLGSMRVGEAGQRIDARIRSKPGAEGFIVYGPFIRLDVSAYRLTVDIHTEPPRDAGAVLIWVEVSYRDVLIGRLDIRGADIDRAVHVLDFSVPRQWAPWLSESEFEFRVWTNGGAVIEVMGLSLERLGEPDAGALDGNAEWLPMLRVGAAGRRTNEGIVAVADLGGHVFFGPYRALMPGTYLLTLECGPASKPDGCNVELEVVGASGAVVSERRFLVRPEASKLELIFFVPGRAEDRVLKERLEVRLGKAASAEFVVTGVTVRALPRPLNERG